MAQEVGTITRQAAADGRTEPASRATRTVRHRRGLPGSRAVVGGLLVAAAAVGLFAAASRNGSTPRQSYVVARHELAAGARLQATDLALLPMDLAPELRPRTFQSTQALVGATLVAPLGPGELVQTSAVVDRKGDAASREITFTLDRGRLGAGIKTGERADLLATYGTGNDAFTIVVVRQALLVGIDRPRTSAGDNGPATVTVAVDDPNDALALAHALQLGKITLVRATGAPPLAGVAPTYRTSKS
jgi:Flp pilus assembly protein CpaB